MGRFLLKKFGNMVSNPAARDSQALNIIVAMIPPLS